MKSNGLLEVYNEINNQKIDFYSETIEFIAIILVILVPVIFYPYLVRIFNPPKELVFESLTLISLAFWLCFLIAKWNIRFYRNIVNLPILLFILIGILSLIWSDNPYITLQELPLFLAGPLLFFIIVNNIMNQEQVNRIITGIISIGSLMGIYGFLQYQGIDFSFWQSNIGRQQVFGLFGNVNYFAEYVIIPLTIAVPILFAVKNKIIKISLFIGIIFMASSLVLTFTRGSYLAFGLALLIMFLLLISWKGISHVFSNYKKLIIFFLLVAIIATAIIFIPNPMNKRGTVLYKIKARTSISQLTQGSSIARRMAIWKFTWMMIEDKPILGSGLGTFQYNSLRYQAEFFNQNNNRDKYPYGIADKVHNEYLQLWSELGIIGLLVFLWIVIQYFVFGIRFLKKAKSQDNMQFALVVGLMGSILAILIDAVFGFPLHLPASISLFWLAMALTFVIVRKEEVAMILNSSYQPKKSSKSLAVKKKKYNLLQLKYLLFPVIIIGVILLIITIARPFVAEVHEYYAIRSIQGEENDRGIEYYKAALKMNPYFGMAYFNIAQILQQKGFYTITLNYYERAEKFFDHPDLPEKLAYMYIKEGSTDKAIPKLEQAILYQQKEKDMAPLYSDLGKLYLQKRKYSDAESAFMSAIKIDEKNIVSHLGYSVAILNQNKKDEAIKELKVVIELAPDSQEASQARGLLQQLARESLQTR
jgi:O-antigen ligase/Flp pilus assembly protein TadD